MRSLPGVQLTRASDYGQYRSSWLVTMPKTHEIMGMVVRDTDVLLPPTNAPWQSFMRMDNGAYRHLDWHRTRREAEHAVLVEYRLRHDEAEAHQIAEMIIKARQKAEEHAACCLAENGPDRHLYLTPHRPVIPIIAPDTQLEFQNAYMRGVVTAELNGRRPDPHGFGLGTIERFTYEIRMNELEMERRKAATL